MSSTQYFQFLESVWELLPDADRERFGELWQGYEQYLAAIYQKYVELTLNGSVADLLPYSTERWLPYTFNSDNFIQRAATITSTQDMSAGLNLTNKYLLKLRIDGTNTFEVNVQGADPQTTRIEEVILTLNLAAGFPFASSLYSNTILYLKSRTEGIGSSIEILPTSNPNANACEFVLGISLLELPKTYPQFRYPYTIPYANVSSIPLFRDHVRDEDVTISPEEGVDYILEGNGIITFKTVPPENLWATRTDVDEEIPWANFGFLTGIYQKNSPRYVGVVQGLWYAFWNGPTPQNVRRSLYLLFGLPTAKEPGTITAVTATQIETTGDSGTVYTVDIPTGLVSEVVVGQRVTTFEPLVDGIMVFDKINYPGFIEAEAGRFGIQRFLTQNASVGKAEPGEPLTDEDRALVMLEEYTFLPQISVDAFIYPDINLRNVRIFLDSFKPLNKTYLFQIIVGTFRELLGLTDRIGIHDDIDLTSNLDSNETTFMDSETLLSYETNDIDALNLDPHGILFDERLEIEVYSGLILIDSFMA
jgi:hypothetical protein